MMSGRLALFAFLLYGVVFFPSIVFAQLEIKNSSDSTSDQWTESVENLKKSMRDVLQKNETLTSENEILRRKVLTLQEELKKIQQQNQSVSDEAAKVNNLLTKKSQDIAEIEKRLQGFNDTVAQLEKEKSDFAAKISQKEQQQSTSDTQLRDLKGQVSQLEQKAKDLEGERARLAKDSETQKKDLSKSLEDSQARQTKAEQELLALKQRPRAKEGQKAEIPQDQNRLREELAQAKSELEAMLKERQRLQDDNLKLSAQKLEGPERVKKEIEDLKKLNKELDKELQGLHKSMGIDRGAASTSRKQEKELQDKILSLERENGSLKQKVSENMEKIVKLNRDKAMAESLLEAQVKMRKMEKVAAKKAESSHQVLGYKYAASGQYKKAISEYELAAKDKPSKDIYFNLGFLYSKQGLDQEAIASYQKVLELDPNDKETNYHLYQIYKKLADETTAQKYYSKFQELQKDQ